MNYWILEQKAPELSKDIAWIDWNWEKLKNPIQLSDYAWKFKIIYCFQSWCPGCHSSWLPTLQKLREAFNNNTKIELFALQTVFEGFEQNSYDKILETQKKYNLDIPFWHDVGDEIVGKSYTMTDYKTGGTPWYILINEKDEVIFNDFHIHPENTIKFLEGYLSHLK